MLNGFEDYTIDTDGNVYSKRKNKYLKQNINIAIVKLHCKKISIEKYLVCIDLLLKHLYQILKTILV